jgi:uncharacterized membrane protein
MTTKEEYSENKSMLYIVAYLFEWVTGIVVYLTAGDRKRLKMHSVQAIMLGVISIILAFAFGLLLVPVVSTVINIIIWLYGMYVGYKAYTGVDIQIPWITEYVEGKLGSNSNLLSKSKTGTKPDTSEPLKALQKRYANGEITRKKYIQMKKDLE